MPNSPWLIGLDIDGTLVHDDGLLSKAVRDEVQRVKDLGHKVTIATGRAAANAYPVIRDLGLDSGFAVCSNGAVTIDSTLPKGDIVTPSQLLVDAQSKRILENLFFSNQLFLFDYYT